MSVQFSYPSLDTKNGNQSQGFFTYSDPANSKYVSFTPSDIAIKNDKLYIKHNVSGANVFVVFNLKENSKSENLYTSNQIKLNNLIIKELSSKDSSFSLNNNITYFHPQNGEYSFSSGTHVFEMPGAIRASKIEATGSVPNNLPNTGGKIIPLTKSSFGSDDTMVCDEADVDGSTTNTDLTSSNTSLTIGIVLACAFGLMGFLGLIKQFQPDLFGFAFGTGLLQGFETVSQKAYAAFAGIFFILSFALFISSGVTTGESKQYSSIFAYVFFVFTIIMMWFKMAIFTAPARAPAT